MSTNSNNSTPPTEPVPPNPRPDSNGDDTSLMDPPTSGDGSDSGTGGK